MNVKIKKTHKDAVIPSYSRTGDAGMDITATEINYTDNYIEYKTGLSIEIPPGFVGLIFPRSSLSNKDLVLCNHVGILDSNFRGEITFRFKELGRNMMPQYYNVGDRIGQLLITPYPSINFIEAEELSSTERGSGAYGSSGA